MVSLLVLHHFEFVFHEASGRHLLPIIIEWRMLLRRILLRLIHPWINELLRGLLGRSSELLLWLRLLRLMLNFFDRVHAEMLLEVEVGVDWFLPEIAAWSSGIGDFGLTRNSWLRVLQRRRIKSIVHILSISIHLPRVWIFDTRRI